MGTHFLRLYITLLCIIYSHISSVTYLLFIWWHRTLKKQKEQWLQNLQIVLNVSQFHWDSGFVEKEYTVLVNDRN